MKEKIVKILSSGEFKAFCIALISFVIFLLSMSSCSVSSRINGTRDVRKEIERHDSYEVDFDSDLKRSYSMYSLRRTTCFNR